MDLKQFIFSTLPVIVSGLAIASILTLWLEWKKSSSKGTPQPPAAIDSKETLKTTITKLDDQAIEPLTDFNYRTVDPIKQRPFKPIWHMSMGIQTLTPSELIQMDKNYLDRINLRKHILATQPDECAVANEAVQPAINELYTWLMGTYLPQRFPTMFQLVPSVDGKPQQLANLVTGDVHPVLPPSDGAASTKALKILGETVEEDWMFLMPSPDGRGYSLQGVMACFPSSWSPKEKHGMTLREIHVPVPRYEEKLELSLERFLGRVEPGKYVRRANWTVTLDNKLWAANAAENHAYDEAVQAVDTIDPEVACLRSERQTVHRLPQSGAICFCFKSYIYPLTDIKAESLGEELSQAIDGLQKGSVPEIHHYKRAGVWGEAVKKYMRS